jgi:phage tail tape-measure protein
MQTILAGHVHTQERAQQVMSQLRERGIALGDMQAFYVTPPGQHGQFPIGGDEYADRDAKDAHRGQLKGAAIGSVAGLAAGGIAAAVVPPLAPVIIAGVTGVGALAGSVAGAGAAAQSKEESDRSDDPQPQLHEGGLMIAVRATPDTEVAIVETLRAAGVTDIERARGSWRDGHWVDFDPKKPAQKLDT